MSLVSLAVAELSVDEKSVNEMSVDEFSPHRVFKGNWKGVCLFVYNHYIYLLLAYCLN